MATYDRPKPYNGASYDNSIALPGYYFACDMRPKGKGKLFHTKAFLWGAEKAVCSILYHLCSKPYFSGNDADFLCAFTVSKFRGYSLHR